MQTSVPFDVAITDDNILEGNEIFILAIDNSLPNGVKRDKNNYQTNVTIVDTTGNYIYIRHTLFNHSYVLGIG